MLYKISEKAQEDLLNIEIYLLEAWSLSILEDFFEKFQKAIILLVDKKVVFKRYEDTEFHQFNITKHNAIIYNYKENILYIHRILQNFQNPDENYKNV